MRPGSFTACISMTSRHSCGDHTASHQSTTQLNFWSCGEPSQNKRILVSDVYIVVQPDVPFIQSKTKSTIKQSLRLDSTPSYWHHPNNSAVPPLAVLCRFLPPISSTSSCYPRTRTPVSPSVLSACLYSVLPWSRPSSVSPLSCAAPRRLQELLLGRLLAIG
jgi:hypothetical protein